MHRFGHIEIPTTNVKNSKRFFEKVFGWTFTDHPEIRYTIIHTGDHPNGGLERVKTMPKRGQVNVYVEVEDIDATLAVIRKARGKVVEKKKQVASMGWAAKFRTPDGCLLCLWQAAPKQ